MSTMLTLNVPKDQFWSTWRMMMSLDPISLLSRVLRGGMNRTQIWAYLCPQLPNVMTEDEEKLFILPPRTHTTTNTERKKRRILNHEIFNMIISRRIDPNSKVRFGDWHHSQVARKLGKKSISLLHRAFDMLYDPLVQYLLRMGAEITIECCQDVMKHGNAYFKDLIIPFLPKECRDILEGGDIPIPIIKYANQKSNERTFPVVKCDGVPHAIVGGHGYGQEGYEFQGEFIFPDDSVIPGVRTYEYSSPKPFSDGYKSTRTLDASLCKWRVRVLIDGRKSPYSEWTEPVTFLKDGRYRIRVLPQTARIIQRWFRKKKHG